MKYKIPFLPFAFMFFITSCNHLTNNKRQEVPKNKNGMIISTEGYSDYSFKYEYAKELLTRNQFDSAIIVYKELMVLEKSSPDPYIGMGSAYSLHKNYETAIKYYTIALSKDENSISTLVGLGSAYIGLSNYKNAKHYYERANKIDFSNPDPYWGLATVYNQLQDIARAKYNARKYLEIVPNSIYKSTLEDILNKH